MRFSLVLFILTIAASCVVSNANAQEQPSLAVRLAARRDLSLAKGDLRYYWQIEYPRKRRELDAAIELTRAAIDNDNSLLREYQPYTRFTIGQPFPITVRNLQMCIREGELRLNDLLAERNALVRFHSDQFNVLASQVYETRLRVAELESDVAEPTQPAVPLATPAQ